MMLRKYGEEFWAKVLQRAGFDAGKENIVNHYYSDSDTYVLIDAVSVMSSEFPDSHKRVVFRDAKRASVGDVWSFSDRVHHGDWMG